MFKVQTVGFNVYSASVNDFSLCALLLRFSMLCVKIVEHSDTSKIFARLKPFKIPVYSYFFIRTTETLSEGAFAH
jgi:hypothetical protein